MSPLAKSVTHAGAVYIRRSQTSGKTREHNVHVVVVCAALGPGPMLSMKKNADAHVDINNSCGNTRIKSHTRTSRMLTIYTAKYTRHTRAHNNKTDTQGNKDGKHSVQPT